MAKEQLKTKKGAVVTEINGVKYFKLQSKYAGDYTKNCGLLGNEIDENFYFLRSNDIAEMTMDEDRNLILTRVDGDELVVNIAEEIGQPSFRFDKKNGKLIITFPDGTQQVLGGFLVEGQDVKTATDATIDGDGTVLNPLSISEVEKTGTYAPAKYFLDLTKGIDEYFFKDKKVDGTWIYSPIDKDLIPVGAPVVQLNAVPTMVKEHDPEYIMVNTPSPMPNGAPLGKGFRIVTKEKIDNFGLLYMFSDAQAIDAKLRAKGSLWRVPTREDWADLLNAAEYCDVDRNHDTECINEWTGKHAGARAKSTNLWTKSYREEDGYPVGGEDNLPSTGSMGTFKVLPVGLGEGSRGPLSRDGKKDGKNNDIEGFHRLASYWSSTEIPNGRVLDGCYNVYTRTFVCDSRKVLQESSKPSSRLAIRLVRDFDYEHMEVSEYENILGYNMPTVLISNPDTNYSKVWTSINVGFKEFHGVDSDEWSAATKANRQIREVYYINEWNGNEWVKKEMNPGDSVVILDYDNDPSTSGDTYMEWRVYEFEDGHQELIDTSEALKKQFEEEIKELHEEITIVCGMTMELSASTVIIEENLNNLSASTLELSASTIELSAATVEIREDLDELSATTIEFSAATEQRLNELQEELDATQVGAGLEDDGSYIDNGAEYLASGTSIHEAMDNLAQNARDNDIKRPEDGYQWSAITDNFIETNAGDLIKFMIDFDFGER